ncbi:MAG TPA: thiol:disulfide interchange protein DsbG [Gammaproteobacteria bacterium]|nr:thiol:disulfide interchange protein DsbG [Gammaproteobacteria bacterium]
MRFKLKYVAPRLLAAAAILALAGFGSAAVAQAPDQAMLQAQWPRLRTAAWIAQGAGQPQHVLYVFFDPNCGYCHRLWLQIQAADYLHDTQIRYILVGIISETSPAKAAAILEAPNPLQALHMNESHWGTAGKGGGIRPVSRLDFSMLMRLRQHERLTLAFGVAGTPGLIWKDRQGRVHVLQGAPPADELARIVASATAG